MDDINTKNAEALKDFFKYTFITLVFCGVSFLGGFIGSVTAIFAISPPTLFFIKHKKLPLSLLMILVVTATVTALTRGEGGVYYVYEFGVINAFLFLVLRREDSFVNIVFKTALFSYLAIFFVVVLLSFLYNVDIHNAIGLEIESNISNISKMYEGVDISAEQLNQLKEIYESIKDIFKKIYPALIFIGFEVTIALNLIVISSLFFKKKPKFNISGLLRWSPDEKWVFGLIFSGFLYFVKSSAANLIALNGLLVFLALYFFSGICIVHWGLKKKEVPGFIIGMVYLTLVFISWIKFLVIAVGVFNIWFDFRKPRVKA